MNYGENTREAIARLKAIMVDPKSTTKEVLRAGSLLEKYVGHYRKQEAAKRRRKKAKQENSVPSASLPELDHLMSKLEQ